VTLQKYAYGTFIISQYYYVFKLVGITGALCKPAQLCRGMPAMGSEQQFRFAAIARFQQAEAVQRIARGRQTQFFLQFPFHGAKQAVPAGLQPGIDMTAEQVIAQRIFSNLGAAFHQ